jgi:hypothetical protein
LEVKQLFVGGDQGVTDPHVTPPAGFLEIHGFREARQFGTVSAKTRTFRFSETVLGIAFSPVYGYDRLRERHFRKAIP